jgi:hypothetical protein
MAMNYNKKTAAKKPAAKKKAAPAPAPAASNGLTAGQKKLPPFIQKSIMAKKAAKKK